MPYFWAKPSTIWFFLVLILITPVTSFSSGIERYQECVLKNVRDVRVEAAVEVVYDICYEKHLGGKNSKGHKISSSGKTEVCNLYFNGLRFSRLEKRPEPGLLLGLKFGRFGIHSYTVWVPKTFKDSDEAREFFSKHGELYC